MMKANLIPVVFAMLLLFSCKKNNDDTGKTHYPLITFPQDVPGDSMLISSFPFATGHSWTYAITIQTYTAQDTSAPSSYDCTIQVTADSVINGVHLYRMGSSNTNNELFLSDEITDLFPTYYAQTTAGLYYPDQSSLIGISNAALAGSFIVLKYQSAPWSYTQTGGYQANKSTTGFVKVTTPLQTFNCLKVTTSSSISGAAKITNQYFSDKGLIQQTQSYSFPVQGGSQTYVLKTMVLKSVNF